MTDGGHPAIAHARLVLFFESRDKSLHESQAARLASSIAANVDDRASRVVLKHLFSQAGRIELPFLIGRRGWGRPLEPLAMVGSGVRVSVHVDVSAIRSERCKIGGGTTG